MTISKLPWVHNGGTKRSEIYDDDNNIVSMVVSADLNEENAAFIVKACNNHERLLQELKCIEAYASGALEQFKTGRGTLDISMFHSLTESAKAAIKQAKES